jgi:hypothetical protein
LANIRVGLLALLALAAGLSFVQHANLLLSWLLLLALIIGVAATAGQAITGLWRGALIDERNVMSLSRMQLLLWTCVILSGYMTYALARIIHGTDNPLNIAMEPSLWALMGISTASLVGSPLILEGKKRIATSLQQLEASKSALGQQHGADPEDFTHQGQLATNREIASARWSDMITGEELDTAPHLDIARLQMLFFTLISVAAFAVYLGHVFVSNAPGVFAAQALFPELDESLVTLLGISHGGYLTAKALPRANASPSLDAKSDDKVDEQQAVG